MWKEMPALRRISARRGEAEARMRREWGVPGIDLGKRTR